MSNKYKYQVFGLNIHSFIELPDLIESNFENADVRIIPGKNPNNIENPISKGVLYQAKQGHFLFKLENVGSYYVQNANLITIDISKPANVNDIRLFLLGTVFGALIHQKGMLPLHGSCILKNGISTLFCGESGIGKSSLAAVFCKRGYSLLADDISVVQNLKSYSSIKQGIVNLKLWHDVLIELYSDPSKYLRVRSQLLRYKVPTKSIGQSTDNQLRNILILEKKNSIGFEINELSGMRKFEFLMANTYRREFLKGLGVTLDHFNQINQLLKNVNVYLVRRPSSPLLLNELATFLENTSSLN